MFIQTITETYWRIRGTDTFDISCGDNVKVSTKDDMVLVGTVSEIGDDNIKIYLFRYNIILQIYKSQIMIMELD